MRNLDIRQLAAVRYAYGGQAYSEQYSNYLEFLDDNSIARPSDAQKLKQNALVKSVVETLGDWERVKSFRLYAGSNADAALVDVKRLVFMTAVNSPTYSASNGYVGNGTTSHINTGFTPSVATAVGAHLIAITAMPSVSRNISASTVTTPSNNRVAIFRGSGSNLEFVYSGGSLVAAQAMGTLPYVAAVVRISPTQVKSWVNTNGLIGGSTYSSVPLNVLGDLALFQNGSFFNSTSAGMGLGLAIDTLSDVEYLAINSAIQTYLS
jgi:hypothetical protein